jgi:hypothetical protein
LITATSSSFVNTPPNPIFLDLVFIFRWLEKELKGMFHYLLALLKKHVPFSIASIIASNVSSIHMPLLLAIGIQFICDGFLLVYDL